jgi:chaperonin cofactor prefoldin
MADERQEVLDGEVKELEEETRKLADRVMELAGVDCNTGACVFDPEMEDVQAKISEIQKRKKTLEDIKGALDTCEA